MNQADEQRITTSYALNVMAKKVIAQFSAPVHNLAMAPAEATRMAEILLNCARELEPASVSGFAWPTMAEPVRKRAISEAPASGKPS